MRDRISDWSTDPSTTILPAFHHAMHLCRVSQKELASPHSKSSATRMPSSLHLFLIVFHSLTSALNIPQSPATTQQTNMTSPSLNYSNGPIRDWECQSGGIPSLHRPSVQDCGSAILRLPNTDLKGTFHTGGAEDDFLLPVIKTRGSCRVRLVLIGGLRQESGNWKDVRKQAGALWSGCRIAVVGNWFIGAETTAGDGGKISIELGYNDGYANEA